jgi:iron complex outermembrane receptor protein
VFIPGSGYRVGVYGQDELRLSERVSATLGLRADSNNVTGTKFSPRAALIWQADDATTLKTLYGIAHRAPNAYERDYYDGVTQDANPALQGESIDTLEWVVDHRIGTDLALRASVYQWTIRNIITLGTDPTNGLAQFHAGGKVHARGAELSGDKTWSAGTRLRASASFQDVQRADGTPMLNSPRFLGKLDFSGPVVVPTLRLGYEFQYASMRRTEGGAELGGYAVSNLVLTQARVIEGLDASLGVYNAFDKHYADPGATTNWQDAIEQDGRSYRVKFTYRF